MQREEQDAEELTSPVAETRQSEAYRRLMERIRDAAESIARDTATDLGRSDDPALAAFVDRFLDGVARGPRLTAAHLRALRAAGARAASDGRPVAEPIDEALSTAWVAWTHATRLDPTPDAVILAELGGALLRAGDDAAAALADGFSAAERALAARGGATRRAVLDELVADASGGRASPSRRARRAALVGLDPGQAHRVVVVRTTVEVEDEGPAPQALERLLARHPRRPSHLVAVRNGDLVAIVGEAGLPDTALAAALATLPLERPWHAAVGGPRAIDHLTDAYAEAVDALRVAVALGDDGRPIPAGAVALERAIVADAGLAAAGVERWLGPLERAPRGGRELIATLQALFGAHGSVTGAARTLNVAPRTVTYRLDRIARLLEVPRLDAQVRSRLATALLARTLLGASIGLAGRPSHAAGARVGRRPGRRRCRCRGRC